MASVRWHHTWHAAHAATARQHFASNTVSHYENLLRSPITHRFCLHTSQHGDRMRRPSNACALRFSTGAYPYPVCMLFHVCVLQEPELHLRKPALFAKCLQLLYCIAEPPLTCEAVFSLLQPSNETYGQLLPQLGGILVEPLPGSE